MRSSVAVKDPTTDSPIAPKAVMTTWQLAAAGPEDGEPKTEPSGVEYWKRAHTAGGSPGVVHVYVPGVGVT